MSCNLVSGRWVPMFQRNPLPPEESYPGKTAVFSSLWISSYQVTCSHIPQNSSCNNVHYSENLIYNDFFTNVVHCNLAGKGNVFYLTVGT